MPADKDKNLEYVKRSQAKKKGELVRKTLKFSNEKYQKFTYTNFRIYMNQTFFFKH